MKNFIAVRLLDKQVIKQQVTKAPGCYRWWFDEESTCLILKKLVLDFPDQMIQKQIFEEREYYALYFGISSNLRARIKWHVLQKHSHYAVSSGMLSTLRQTLSALLEIPMSESEIPVNNFIRSHCFWEWEGFENPKELEKAELSNTQYYYPLNIQENRSLPKEIIKRLKQMRLEFKK